MNTLPTRPIYAHTSEDWSQLRAHFMSSMLMDTHLHKLAQNIGLSWPLRESGETPSKYLDYSFEELPTAPGLDGQPQRLTLLLDILKETAAFDQPFQGMVETAPPPAKKKETTVQLLKRNDIPPGYPVKFTGLSLATKDLCAAEGSVTLSDAIHFLQNLAQTVLVNGEVKQFLNALTHADTSALTRFLPIRAGSKGLHFAEAIALLIRSLPSGDYRLLATAHHGARTGPAPDCERIEEALCREIEHLFPWFHEEKSALAVLARSGEPIDRFFLHLNDPECEAIAKVLTLRLFPRPVEEARPKSFMGKMSAFFRSGQTKSPRY